MRTDPIKTTPPVGDDSAEGVTYKKRAAIALVFIGVFYFLFKVIFNL